ncbi:MAG: GDSL-type esterase/lipase family protein [Methanospirillum sp.]
MSLIAALVLVVALCGVASAAVRILPLGDSITAGGIGGASFGSYRVWLYQDLRALGYDVDFVGSLDLPSVPPGADPDHEGHPGYTAGQIAAELPAWLPAYPAPEVALVHLGTNDADQAIPVDRTIADLTSIVGTLRARNPSMTILVAQIIPTSFASTNVRIEALNREIAHLSSLSTAQSPVVIVDQWSGYDGIADNQADGVHPLVSGERKMAAGWLDALRGILGSGGPAPVTDLNATSSLPTSITWTWTDPGDPAFASVAVALDGVSAGVVPKGVRRFTATDLAPNTRHTIGTRTVDADGRVGAVWVNHTASTARLAPFPGGEEPTDLDGDGRFEDVNGNGRADFADVVLYFNRMEWIAANEPLSAFDCNGNGRIDFADVVWLFGRL